MPCSYATTIHGVPILHRPLKSRPSPGCSPPDARSPPPRRINVLDRIPAGAGTHERRRRRWRCRASLVSGRLKRPEMKVPSLVLWLTSGDVLDRGDSVAAAISRGAAIVVLDAVGCGRLYEAACALKSVVCDRACLIISERADVAAAVGASGVLLSDQGIPLIVVRNMMLQSQSDSLYLPVVGRIVQTATSAINASDSKGADFFVMDISRDNFDWLMDNSTSGQSPVPIFVRVSGLGDEYESSSMVSKISQLGVYGLVMSLDDMDMLDDHFLKKTFPSAHVDKISSQGRNRNPLTLCMTDVDILNWRKSFAGFSSIAGEAIELIEAEKLLLHDAVAIFLKSAPMVIF